MIARRAIGRVAVLIAVLLPTPALALQAENDDQSCYYNVIGRLVCTFTGSEEGTATTTTEPPAELFIYVATDPGVGQCWFLSRVPHPVDPIGSTAIDPSEIAAWIRDNLPHCPPEVVATVDWAYAWSVFASLPLEVPEPRMEPAVAGITGLATYVSDDIAAPFVDWSGVLPSGAPARVEATLEVVTIDWGDDTVDFYLPHQLGPFPDGSATHTYTLKTCPPEYRTGHPRGGLCHPTLEAYPIEAVYTWSGRYESGSGWVDLGTLDLSTVVQYDVDEVIGVLN